MANRDNNTRQIGPAIGQKYWFTKVGSTDSYEYRADHFDLNVFEVRGGYPEERYAEAELRARRLITGVNERRRELNAGKELGGHQCYIVYWNVFREAYELDARVASNPLYAQGEAYPFGLFKNSEDCEKCMREFEDELRWFYEEYLPLMAELDDYDWSEAPGWRG